MTGRAGPRLEPYVALPRGINVGGRNRVPMADLRAALAARGLPEVSTYIASGNVILRVPPAPDARERLSALVSTTIAEEFGVSTAVLVRTGEQMTSIALALPQSWVNDGATRTEVLYLFDEIDDPGVLDELSVRHGVDHVRYTPGAVLWAIERAQVRRSKLAQVVGSPIYPLMTIRNASTARRLAELVAT